MLIGLTHDQIRDKEARLQDWHTWTAWYPVELLDGRIAAFRKVERKKVVVPRSSWYEGRVYWVFRAIK